MMMFFPFVYLLVGETNWRNISTFQRNHTTGWFSGRNGQQHLPECWVFLSNHFKGQGKYGKRINIPKSCKKKSNDHSFYCFDYHSDNHFSNCNKLNLCTHWYFFVQCQLPIEICYRGLFWRMERNSLLILTLKRMKSLLLPWYQ